MLAWLGFGMVITFMTLIMTRRLSPLVALITVPIVFALLGGFGAAELGTMMLSGLRTLAPTGVMLMFAILYFGLMIDAGLFDPLIRAILARGPRRPDENRRRHRAARHAGFARWRWLHDLHDHCRRDAAALQAPASRPAEPHLRDHSRRAA